MNCLAVFFLLCCVVKCLFIYSPDRLATATQCFEELLPWARSWGGLPDSTLNKHSRKHSRKHKKSAHMYKTDDRTLVLSGHTRLDLHHTLNNSAGSAGYSTVAHSIDSRISLYLCFRLQTDQIGIHFGMSCDQTKWPSQVGLPKAPSVDLLRDFPDVRRY